MEISVSMPLDDGFLRRQCPNCNREFKWHEGPTDDRPDHAVEPPMYYCPYCGLAAGADEWWTEAQLDYAEAIAAGPAMREIADQLERAIGTKNHGLISISVNRPDEPEPLAAMVEPNDMLAVASPCHPWEPFKVAEDWSDPLHCLVCGERFQV
jgi:Zn ribbon nucleic-acid-binding protein